MAKAARRRKNKLEFTIHKLWRLFTLRYNYISASFECLITGIASQNPISERTKILFEAGSFGEQANERSFLVKKDLLFNYLQKAESAGESSFRKILFLQTFLLPNGTQKKQFSA